MNINRLVFAVAGAMIIISVSIAAFHSRYRLWFTAFIGANMAQAAFADFRPLHFGVEPAKLY